MANKKEGCLGAGKEGLTKLGRIQDSVIGSWCFYPQRESYRFTVKENKLDPGDCGGGEAASLSLPHWATFACGHGKNNGEATLLN